MPTLGRTRRKTSSKKFLAERATFSHIRFRSPNFDAWPHPHVIELPNPPAGCTWIVEHASGRKVHARLVSTPTTATQPRRNAMKARRIRVTFDALSAVPTGRLRKLVTAVGLFDLQGNGVETVDLTEQLSIAVIQPDKPATKASKPTRQRNRPRPTHRKK